MPYHTAKKKNCAFISPSLGVITVLSVSSQFSTKADTGRSVGRQARETHEGNNAKQSLSRMQSIHVREGTPCHVAIFSRHLPYPTLTDAPCIDTADVFLRFVHGTAGYSFFLRSFENVIRRYLFSA